jgi:hypothetical protein
VIDKQGVFALVFALVMGIWSSCSQPALIEKKLYSLSVSIIDFFFICGYIFGRTDNALSR